MKRNQIIRIILPVLSLMMITGCVPSPAVYQEEIEDVVRFHIATAVTMADTYARYEKKVKSASWLLGDELTLYAQEKAWEEYCDSIGQFEESINELWLQAGDGEGYRIALTQLANNQDIWTSTVASNILENYNAIGVLLSDYQKIETSSASKIWKFTELNTGLEGTFSVDDDYKWHCEISDTSFEKYLIHLIQ